jgi:hydroxyethylthiazole kinase-like uncharacterized protein yjeF
MTKLLTSAQMRASESAVIASGAVTGLTLMERAGQGVVEAVFEEWPDLAQSPCKAVVLCGPGNNGGDGFVIARLLKKLGWDVDVFLYGDPNKLPTDARINCERWCETGRVRDLKDDSLNGYAEDNSGTVLAIDALFGTGLSRPFDTLAGVRKTLNHWHANFGKTPSVPRVVSVDVPSGLCADSGRYLGDGDISIDTRVMSNLTVSFHTFKQGHFLAFGAQACTKTVVKDIGLELRTDLSAASLICGVTDELAKPASSHKFSHGHALVLSGPSGKTGAARLAARGALRIGAGVVTVGSPKSALLEHACQLTAIMLTEVGDPLALQRSLQDTRINALCLGPALGVDTRAAQLIEVALKAARKTVLDADALTLLSQDEALFAKLHQDCVLTPHAGEFKRLFPDLAEKLATPATTGPAYSKVDAARDAANRAGCTVLFKGPDTVIASSSGRVSICASLYDRAAPWLATAGSGDVLAGFITGLLARGFSAHKAAENGAYLHADCALSFGAGLIAEDLPDELPKVFKAIGL